MALKEDFDKAVKNAMALPVRPSQDELLQLYSLYKQAMEGDVSGKRPGMLDLKGRAKFDAWGSRKGMAPNTAMTDYIALVTRLRG